MCKYHTCLAFLPSWTATVGTATRSFFDSSGADHLSAEHGVDNQIEKDQGERPHPHDVSPLASLSFRTTSIKMITQVLLPFLALLLPLTTTAWTTDADSGDLLTDINVIKRYWGQASRALHFSPFQKPFCSRHFHDQRDSALRRVQITPYNDTPASYWGVQNTGLPYGCGYE